MDLMPEMTSSERITLVVSLIPVALALLTLRNPLPDRKEMMRKSQRSKPAKIEAALKCESITGLTRYHLRQVLASEHFRSVTGMRLEKEWREAIIEAHKSTKGKLAFTTFKRALQHFEVSGMNLTVRISRSDWVTSVVRDYLGLFLALLGVVVLALSPLIETLMLPIMGVTYISIAMFVWYLNWSVNSAKVIYRHLHPDSQSRHASNKPKFRSWQRLREKLGPSVYVSFVRWER